MLICAIQILIIILRAEISDSKVDLVALDSGITVLRKEYGIDHGRVTVGINSHVFILCLEKTKQFEGLL